MAVVLAGDRWLHLRHLLADWMFARDLARGARPELDARIERFAQEIIAARHRQDVDEVALVGHSLGMVLLTEALATALAREPAPRCAGRRPRLALVGLGSSVLKIALMPQAAPAARGGGADRRRRRGWPGWNSPPAATWCASTGPTRSPCSACAGRGPRIERIHPRAMLDHAAWCRVRRSMLRAHRIYVTGCGRRYFYDWGLIACGPGAVGAGPVPRPADRAGRRARQCPRWSRPRDTTCREAAARAVHGRLVGDPAALRAQIQRNVLLRDAMDLREKLLLPFR